MSLGISTRTFLRVALTSTTSVFIDAKLTEYTGSRTPGERSLASVVNIQPRRSDRAARSSALSWAMVALLAVVSCIHLAKGFYFLAVQQPARAIADLRNRRIETAYFLDRVSPLSQQLLAIDPADTGGWAAGADPTWSHGFENAHGAVPPWTYPTQLAIVPPLSERAARVYLAALDAAALIVIASLAVVRAGSAAGPASALVVLSPLAIGANDNALTQGQNSLIV